MLVTKKRKGCFIIKEFSVSVPTSVLLCHELKQILRILVPTGNCSSTGSWKHLFVFCFDRGIIYEQPTQSKASVLSSPETHWSLGREWHNSEHKVSSSKVEIYHHYETHKNTQAPCGISINQKGNSLQAFSYLSISIPQRTRRALGKQQLLKTGQASSFTNTHHWNWSHPNIMNVFLPSYLI